MIDESLWAVAAPSAGLSRKRPVSLDRVAREPFILPSAPQGLRAAIEHAAAEAGVTLQVFAETNALSVQKELVAQGHGWTILPAVGVTQEVEQGTLSAAPLASPGVRRTIVLAAPSSRQATAPVRCVVGVLLDCVKATFDRRLAGRALAGLGRACYRGEPPHVRSYPAGQAGAPKRPSTRALGVPGRESGKSPF